MSYLPDNTSDELHRLLSYITGDNTKAGDIRNTVSAINTLITQRENAAKLKGQANLIIELQNAEVIDDIDAEHWYAQIESELSPKLLEENK